MTSQPPTTALQRPALKEWAVVNRSLRAGRQIIDLRKGGLREEGHRFRVRALRFWLYDSFEHQRSELIRPELAPLYTASEAGRPQEGKLRFEGWADLVETAALDSPEQVAALRDHHVWTDDYAEQRFRWRPKAPLLLLVLRVHRLRDVLVVPEREHYEGCTSWVPMLDVPDDPTELNSRPVLPDAEWERRLDALHAALPGASFQPAAVDDGDES